MLVIRPFRGITYNQERISDLGKVVAPPYDVISTSGQKEYYQLHPYNIIRIILGKEYPGDDDKENKYTRAAKYFKEWLSSGILKRDSQAAIYVYEQEYPLKGKVKRRRGFIALMKLEEFGSGVVFPHERTFPQAKLDRLKLLRCCRANLSSIFSLYSDPSYLVDKYLEKTTPSFALRDKDGVRHLLGAIRDTDIIERIVEAMKDKKIFIADGHHRYLTALKFREEERTQTGEENFVMMYFLNMEADVLTILPVHRVIGNLGLEEGLQLRKKLSDFFQIETFDFVPETEKAEMEEMFRQIQEAKDGYIFGMYCGERRYYLLSLKESYRQDFKGRVNTAVLDELMTKRILKKKGQIDFVKDERRAVNLVREGKYQAAFFLKPPSLRQIKEVALSDGVMPPKSSYFYPKLLSGLVMRELNPDLF
ncbi:MAG: DUF1015 domain-containing protein [Candidatus Aerophobetes bacterium]|nr:DUF1015 domain-containing protein [Candidatus Aerophobetes bacterium]